MCFERSLSFLVLKELDELRLSKVSTGLDKGIDSKYGGFLHCPLFLVFNDNTNSVLSVERLFQRKQ